MANGGSFSINLGNVMPDFACETTAGNFTFHEFLDSDKARPWTILFSHPADFTPVCTTELGRVHLLAENFAKRGIKLIGISCDGIDDHKAWSHDIMARIKMPHDSLAFPIIADKSRDIVVKLGMLDPLCKNATGIALPARSLVVIDADKKVRLSILYPASCGRNFDEVERVVESLLLTEKQKLATPVDWKVGDRCIVAPVCPTEEAEKQFKNMVIEELPSKKPYLRTVDCPNSANPNTFA